METHGSHMRVSYQRPRADPPNQLVAERLRALIARLNISQEAFARSIDVSRETVRRWLALLSPLSATSLRRIREVYGVDLMADDDVQESDVIYAPADLVDRVIADMELDAELGAHLRATAWNKGLPSEATLRSYAIDLRGQMRGKLKQPPETRPVVREGAMRLKKR